MTETQEVEKLVEILSQAKWHAPVTHAMYDYRTQLEGYTFTITQRHDREENADRYELAVYADSKRHRRFDFHERYPEGLLLQTLYRNTRKAVEDDRYERAAAKERAWMSFLGSV